MILHAALILWTVALVAGMVGKRIKERRLARMGAMRYVTHTQTFVRGA